MTLLDFVIQCHEHFSILGFFNMHVVIMGHIQLTSYFCVFLNITLS